MSAPPEELTCGPVRLRRWTVDDLPGMVEASASSWAELHLWMPWAEEPATPESALPFLSASQDSWRSGEAYQYAVLSADAASSEGPAGSAAGGGRDVPVLGSCGLMRRIGPAGLEIGYWVRTSHTRQGLATAAATALTWAGLRLPGVDHLEIHCDAANVRSAAVPARLGYHLVTTRAKERAAPGESGQEQVWRLTADDWPTSAAAARWQDARRA